MNKQMLRWIVYGGLFVVPFVAFLVFGSLFFPYITSKVFVFRIIVEIIFASWVILALLDENYRPKNSPLLVAVSVFVALIGLADLLGVAPLKSFWSNFERMEGFMGLLHLWMYFVVAGSVLSKRNWAQWWNTSLVASGLMVGSVLLQMAGGLPSGWRVDGTFGNPTYLAVYMLFHFFIALLLLVRRWKSAGLRWTYGLLGVAHLFVIYNTGTRGAMLGVLGGLFILALLNLKNAEYPKVKKVSAFAIITLLVMVGGFWAARNTSFVQESRVLSRFANISTTELRGGGRSFIWPMAIEGIKERPILGWGQENFQYIFQEHYDPAMHGLEPWFDRAHNIFLDWGVAGGVLGLLSYLAIYGVLLYMVWKGTLPWGERTVLTALVGAYFFHNLFVFDHLMSYVLFFSLLAYIHSGREAAPLWKRDFSPGVVAGASLAVAVSLVASLYLWNIRPISANASITSALRYRQLGQPALAAENYVLAYERASLGKAEIAEQVAVGGVSILSSDMPIEERNGFFGFVSKTLKELTDEHPEDARYHLAAGSFMRKTGHFDEAETYLLEARDLMPAKQAIYLELGILYLQAGDRVKGLAQFEEAYQMAPLYDEAKLLYLAGTIYAQEKNTEERMIREISERTLAFDDRIVAAYRDVGRMSDARALLEKRKILDPENAEKYQMLIEQIQN